MQTRMESFYGHCGFQSPLTEQIHREVFKSPTNNAESSDDCFKKGTYIELSTGTVRRVEDIRTEDFIQSASRSDQFDLKEATVVKIERTSSHIINITCSFDVNYSKVILEVSPGHPLFVYGQGWASCNPELSFQLFELKCQQLQVGDICLSLVKKKKPESNSIYCPVSDFPVNHNRSYDMINNSIFSQLPFNPNQVYTEMAKLVAAYTQHMINNIKD